MTKFLFLLCITALLASSPALAQDAPTMTPEQIAADTGTVVVLPPVSGEWLPDAWQWLQSNLAWLLPALLLLAEFITRLIPGERDNTLLQKLKTWLDAIVPNRKKGGGTFAAAAKC